jgi:hypothetical protein
LNVGFGTIVALVDLLAPAARGVFVDDPDGFAGDALLAGRALGGRAGGVVGRERLGIDAVDPVGPAAIVLDARRPRR